jgi:hypothetical protein
MSLPIPHRSGFSRNGFGAVLPMIALRMLAGEIDQSTIEDFQRVLSAEKQNRLNTAIAEYSAVICDDPRFAEAYQKLGVVYHLPKNIASLLFGAAEALHTKPDVRLEK